MFNISDFFKKFQKFDLQQTTLKELFNKEAETLGIPLKNSHLEIRNGTIFVNASPAVKSELFMKKKSLLEALNKNFPKKIIDIR